MLCSLRGTVRIYHGEELELTEADIPFDALRDPYGIAFWPRFKGRVGRRTPMPWNTGTHGGPTRGVPWRPVPREHLDLAVWRQEANPALMLQGFRTFMRWRHQHAVLRNGRSGFSMHPNRSLRSCGKTTMNGCSWYSTFPPCPRG